MRKLFLVLGIIFTLLAILFSVLPFDTLAFLPIGLALIFCLVLLKKSDVNQKMLPNALLLLCVLSSVYVVGKTIFIKDAVVKDVKFEQQKVNDTKESKKELENLEKDLQ
ncbi:hypothetical protein [Flavobacterium sp.]|uniref:hypothetical protein n=1 Tax=Flavobacterium sp. TaxID=239 RepID=UPI0025E459C3|nr:hypothetical protein [Flavobacterium sp.]